MRKNSKCQFISGVLSGMVFSGLMVVGLGIAKEFSEKIERRQQVKTLLPIYPDHWGQPLEEEYPILSPKMEAPKSNETVSVREEQVIAPETQTVYWTDYGKTYHIDSKCTSIIRSKDVQSGTVAEATDRVARTPCHYCSQK